MALVTPKITKSKKLCYILQLSIAKLMASIPHSTLKDSSLSSITSLAESPILLPIQGLNKKESPQSTQRVVLEKWHDLLVNLL